MFGSSVSLTATDDRLLVGAPGDDGAGNVSSGAGAAYVFGFTGGGLGGSTFRIGTIGKGYSGSSLLAEHGSGSLDIATLKQNDGFGTSLAVDRTFRKLAVGAPGDDGFAANADQSGAVYVFDINSPDFSGTTFSSKLGLGYTSSEGVNVANLEAGDMFGSALSFADEGKILSVGAPQGSGAYNSVLRIGEIYVFNAGSASGLPLFGHLPGSSTVIDASQIAATISAGTSVTLQANNDITVVAWGRSPCSRDATSALTRT
jgi:hypothetical protein